MQADELTKLIGLRVRRQRERLGLSQEKLGALCGLHRTYIGAVERGEKRVTVVTLARIAEALGLPVGSFVRR